ncbi:pentatricopeptide repeat-containing protein At2g17525, mitochondrial [Phoenix dactylifera]|uniref:Pentatricopeptide repeat-containing protein At2g17525, mitochondrial n=1 Tax=Phoenix dactylifera TaxID=42345 RepID=A0A8B8ZE81_PHODC|nr:pentatricopeptide repeat-containing protein At2g17525, mitochondrial [Phoenix dactylifera]
MATHVHFHVANTGFISRLCYKPASTLGVLLPSPMLIFPNPSKSPLSPAHIRRLFPAFLPSKPFSSSSSSSFPTPTTAPTPTPEEDLAGLILQQKTPSAALRIFRWAARIPSFPAASPAASTALLRSFLSSGRPAAALRLLSALPSPPDDTTLVSLIRALSRAGNPHGAFRVPDLLRPHRSPSLRLLNSVLDALVQHDIDLARHFFRRKMAAFGVRGDERTFGILMKGLCRTNRIAEAFKLLKLMKDSGLTPNPVIYNTLIHALCRNGKVGTARSLMREMNTPSDITFNILISAFCGDGSVVQALVMLEKCFDLGFVPDAISVTKIVELLCNHSRAMEAVELLERVENKGGVVDTVAYTTLIKGLCRMKKPQVGRRVLKEMESKGVLPNVHTYNSLISGFCDSGKLGLAMELFEEMRMDGISPNFKTFDTLIRGLCFGGRITDGLKVVSLMEEERGGHGDSISPYNSVLYGLYKEGSMEEAFEFLNRMASSFPRAVDRSLRILRFCQENKVEEAKMVYDQMVGEGDIPSVLIYESLIEGLCKEGNVREAFDLMNLMVEKDLFPEVSTFNALIHGFCREGKFRSASKLLDEMVKRGCNPNSDSYSSLICGLCKQGDLDKAFGFLVQMVEADVIPDQDTWNSLLTSEQPWLKCENGNQINDVLGSSREN